MLRHRNRVVQGQTAPHRQCVEFAAADPVSLDKRRLAAQLQQPHDAGVNVGELGHHPRWNVPLKRRSATEGVEEDGRRQLRDGAEHGVGLFMPPGLLPLCERRIEALAVFEHRVRVDQRRSSPVGHVWVALEAVHEHAFGVFKPSHAPLGNVERIERKALCKHERGVAQLGRLPLGELLVEAFARLEHAICQGEVRNVPLVEVGIELRTLPEHGLCIFHSARIPVLKPDSLEVLVRREHRGERPNVLHVPPPQVRIEAVARVCKDVAHVAEIRRELPIFNRPKEPLAQRSLLHVQLRRQFQIADGLKACLYGDGLVHDYAVEDVGVVEVQAQNVQQFRGHLTFLL